MSPQSSMPGFGRACIRPLSIDPPSATGRFPSRAPRSRRERLGTRLTARLFGACLLAAGLLPGCSEWDRYWEEDTSPLGPVIAPDITPPTIAILSPSAQDSTQATPVSGSAYVVRMEARDDEAVARVVLLIDGQPVVELTAAPWEFEWDTTPLEDASTHRLAATAEDAAGNRAGSGDAFAQVFNLGPTLHIDAPSDSALVKGTIEITAAFDGDPPEIAQVEFLADVWSLGVLTEPPWSLTLDTENDVVGSQLLVGQHFLAAKATTVLGHIGVSPAVRIFVNNGVPDVSFGYSIPDTVATKGTLVLDGVASDSQEGPIPAERIVWRSSLEGTLGSGPLLWRPNLAVGTHRITVTATNAWGTPDSAVTLVEVVPGDFQEYTRTVHQDVFDLQFCIHCHKADSGQETNGLYLTSYEETMAGGLTTYYRIVYPCRPESSLVYNKVTSDAPWVGSRMPPPNEPFPPIQPGAVAKLERWIRRGAPPDPD